MACVFQLYRSDMNVRFADVYIAIGGTTTRTPVNVTFAGGGLLHTSQVKAYLPSDPYWEKATQIWLKVATSR